MKLFDKKAVQPPGAEPMPGKIVLHDLLTEDPAAARRFYGGLFGWTFREVGLGRGQSYTVNAGSEPPAGPHASASSATRP